MTSTGGDEDQKKTFKVVKDQGQCQALPSGGVGPGLGSAGQEKDLAKMKMTTGSVKNGSNGLWEVYGGVFHRLVLGLALFNISIDELGTKIGSMLVKFTDIKKLGDIIIQPRFGVLQVQNDLEN